MRFNITSVTTGLVLVVTLFVMFVVQLFRSVPPKTALDVTDIYRNTIWDPAFWCFAVAVFLLGVKVVSLSRPPWQG